MARRTKTLALALAILGCSACWTPATEVVVEVDSDAPLRRVLTITVRASTSADPGTPRMWSRGTGVDGGIRLPASFAIVRSSQSPADEQVTLTIVATLAPTATEAAVTIHRVARFTYVPNQIVRLPIFLAMSCGALATGCHMVPAADCTLSQLCEEQGLTCDDLGHCSSTSAHTMPTTDAGGADATDIVVREGCVPACGARVCGTDGCGGTCGSCPPGHTCTTDGHCACMPACSGRACGDDGCGGSCGACPSGQMCDGTGQCVASPCVPDCTGRSCGPDPRCGNSCGSCATGFNCNGSGQCVCSPNCAGRNCGSDGCGGSCGGCSGGQSCDGSGHCVCPSGQGFCGGSCINLSSDLNNCGACGNVCPSGETCTSGACVCGTDHRLVGGVCLPSCGAALTAAGLPNAGFGCCSTPCTTTEVGPTFDCTHCCSSTGNAACGCTGGLTDCGGSCISTQFDSTNCGGCGITCTSGTNPACCYGGCTDLDSDPTNCGSCGVNCAGVCNTGVCF